MMHPTIFQKLMEATMTCELGSGTKPTSKLLQTRRWSAPPQRRSPTKFVTFAPLPPSHKKRESTSLPPRWERQGMIPAPSKGFRPDYSIGDAARCSSHMITKLSSEEQFQAVNSLKKHDFAFIKRSDGSYSYAILAFRSLELPDDQQCIYVDSLDECMTWVYDNGGSVKMLKKDKWAENVRLVSTGVSNTPDTTSRKNKKHRMSAGKEDWIPPSVISFVPVQHGNRPNLD